MGNIRTPKTIYKNGFVMSFSVRNKEIYYVIYKWNKEGTNRSDIESGKLGNSEPQDILNSTLQKFTNVEVL